MATHSSVLAWRISGMGLTESDTTEVTQQQGERRGWWWGVKYKGKYRSEICVLFPNTAFLRLNGEIQIPLLYQHLQNALFL